mgnify:CR=1 FL=1
MKKIVSLGFDEARAEGKAQEKFATAKRMLALGKSLQDIMLITDLPMSKIQELQSEIKSAYNCLVLTPPCAHALGGVFTFHYFAPP